MTLPDNSASGPAWRVARAELDGSSQGGSVPRSHDPLVNRFKAYLACMRKCGRAPTAMRWLNGPLGFVEAVYNDVRPSCVRHAIEAAVLARAEPEFYWRHIHPALVPEVVDLYVALFFDVRKHLDSRVWIDTHVLAPASAITDDKLRESGFMWKLYGLAGGPKRLLVSGMHGSAYSREDFEWSSTMTASAAARRVLNRVHSGDRLLLEAGASIDAGVAKSWLESKTAPSEISNALENPALEALAKAVSGQLTMLMPGNGDQGAEERFDGKIKTY